MDIHDIEISDQLTESETFSIVSYKTATFCVLRHFWLKALLFVTACEPEDKFDGVAGDAAEDDHLKGDGQCEVQGVVSPVHLAHIIAGISAGKPLRI